MTAPKNIGTNCNTPLGTFCSKQNLKNNRKIMKNLKTLKLIAAIVVGVFAANSSIADGIAGDIQFTGSGTLNNTGIDDATQITNFSGVETNQSGSTGHYAGIADDTSVTIQDLILGEVGTGTKQITNFWSLTSSGETYSFDLASITDNSVTLGTLIIIGTGTAKPPSRLRRYVWHISLSTSSSGTAITFSSVPVCGLGHAAYLDSAYLV